jgi:hypothetical protein
MHARAENQSDSMKQTSLKKRVYLRTRIFVGLVAACIAWINIGMPLEAPELAKVTPPGWLVSGATVLLGVLVSALSSVPGPQFKASLTFLRRKHALAGCRAFEPANLSRDPRIDRKRLRQAVGNFPRSPVGQNALWYRLYEAVQTDPRVEHMHFEYLLFRDLTWLGLVLTLASFISAFINPASRPAIYVICSGLILLTILFRAAASERGTRFVNTVLAISAANVDEVPTGK